MSKIVQKWKKVELEQTEITVKVVNSLKEVGNPKEIGLALDYADDNYSMGSLYGLAVATESGNYYIAYDDFKNDQATLDLLKNPDVKKYCYDYKAIKVALAKNDIAIAGLYFDLLVASYLVDSSLKNDVEVVMNIYGIDLSNGAEMLSLLSNEDSQKTGKIAFFSWKLCARVTEELKKTESLKLYQELETPLTDTLADMEIEGFTIDVKVLDSFGDEYKKNN